MRLLTKKLKNAISPKLGDFARGEALSGTSEQQGMCLKELLHKRNFPVFSYLFLLFGIIFYGIPIEAQFLSARAKKVPYFQLFSNEKIILRFLP